MSKLDNIIGEYQIGFVVGDKFKQAIKDLFIELIGEDYTAEKTKDNKYTLHFIPAAKNQEKADLRDKVKEL